MYTAQLLYIYMIVSPCTMCTGVPCVLPGYRELRVSFVCSRCCGNAEMTIIYYFFVLWKKKMYNLNVGLLTLINMHVPLCTPLYY